MNTIQRILFRFSIAGVLLWFLAPLARGDVAAVVNQVSQSSYQGYMENSLNAYLGSDRGTPAVGHMYFGAQHHLMRTNIQHCFQNDGLTTTMDAFDPGFGPGSGYTYVNVVGQLTGVTRPNDVYIVGAHYDSVGNPGADDDASGVAGVLEAARVLSQYRFDATLRFVAFDGEETEIYGSKHYAVAAKQAGENIVGMLALDMIACKRMGDEVEVIGVEADAVTANVLQSVRTYSGLNALFGGQDTNSDHFSFTQSGYQACLLFERGGGSNPHMHQASDGIDTPNYVDYDYATKITKGAVAYLASQAGLIGPRPLAAPVIAPASGITETSFYANWNSVARATNYWLQVATSATFIQASLVPGYERVSIGLAPNWLVSNLSAGTTYYYRVQAQDSTGTSEYSTAASAQSKPPRASDNTWTILVYAHADHNLTPNLISDLNEMEQAGSSAGFNIVVQTDFNASLNYPGVPPAVATGVTRFLIQRDFDPNTFTTPALERLPESNNMDDPQVLADFITWGIQKYPARRYGLVLWDHGGQFQGFGGDTQDGTITPGRLATAQIRDAVSNAMQNCNVPKLDFLSYDTCLMGGVEVLPDVAPLTDLYIACPELDYGDGWDYGAALGGLKTNPSMTAVEFGMQEAVAWQNHHMRLGNRSDLALAAHVVYDLTKYTNFIQSFNAFGMALNAAAIPANTVIPQARLQTTTYNVDRVENAGKTTSYIDLGDFASRVALNSPGNPDLAQAATVMVSNMQSMIVARVMGTFKTNAVGLSVYYPVAGSTGDAYYLGLSASTMPGASWPAFLATVAQNYLAVPRSMVVVSEGDTNMTISSGTTVTARFMPAGGQAAFRCRASVVDHQLYGESNTVVYLGEVDVLSTTISNEWQFQWNGMLPMLTAGADSTNAVWFGGFFDEADDSIMTGYAEYTAPGMSNSQSVVLMAEWNANGTGSIINVLDADAFESMMGPRGISLQPGGTLRPVYYMEKRLSPDDWTGDDYLSPRLITIPETGIAGLNLLKKPVPPGTYSLEVQAVSLYDDLSEPLIYLVTVKPPGPPLQIVHFEGYHKIIWPTASGFVPQVATNLTLGTWSDVATNRLVIEGGNTVLNDTNTGPACFYRLREK